ncbi:MAG: hypothetical protein JJU11_13655 [Candidatus Sumerlaeia bacterium]|nr:hypothetical protein [Candidatus Sumerlaeia bacterium]
MRWILLIGLLLASIVYLGREILHIGEVRQSGGDLLPHYRRLRRRLKSSLLLLFLFVLAFFYEDFAAWGQFDARTSIVYFLGTLVVLIWLLIVATRDARATALEAIEEGRRITEEALQSVHPINDDDSEPADDGERTP